MLPQGSVTVVYDATATPASVQMNAYTQVLAIPANITISLTGLSATPSAIHLHEPAGFTATSGVLLTICAGQSCIFNGGTQTFTSINLPIRMLNGNLPSLSSWPYWSVYTPRNPGGELRGRTIQLECLPKSSSSFTRAAVTYFEDALCMRLSFDLQKQNLAPFSPMRTRSGLPTPSGIPNPVIFPIDECVASPLLPNVWERVAMNGCDGGSVTVVSYRDSSCIQIRMIRPFSKQCTPVTFPSGVTLFARATCSAQSLPAGQIRRPFLSTLPLNVLYLNQGPVSFTYTATSNQEPPPAFVSSCARATFSVTFRVDRSISFSDIIFSGFTSGNLIAAHIHGPCPLPSGIIGSEEGFVPCNAPPIYGICSGSTCPTGANPRISAFVVNKLQPFGNTDSSLLIGLYESILSGNNLYYVNFHTDRYDFPFFFAAQRSISHICIDKHAWRQTSNTHFLNRYPNGEIRADLLVPYGMVDISISVDPSTSSSVTVRLQNLKGMPNSIQVFNAAWTKDPLNAPITLCGGSAPLGSTSIMSPVCNAADLKSSGLFAFRQTFSPYNLTNLDGKRFAMAFFVATTAVPFPGELRGQTFQPFMELMHTAPPAPPTPVVPPSPTSTVSISVPLNFGQENAVWSRVYVANPIDTGACIITASGATFTLTLTPSSNSITVSDIIITQLSTALTAVHIHGPCPRNSDNNDGAACNANVVFTICGPPSNQPCPLANALGALTIPGFRVDESKLQVVNLYQDLVTGLNLYYINFHTNA